MKYLKFDAESIWYIAHERSPVDLPLINDHIRSKSRFVGFESKMKILQGDVVYPIKAYFRWKSIFIDIKHFEQTFFFLHCQSLNLWSHKWDHNFAENKTVKFAIPT